MYVAAEINRRGGNAVTFAGNIADIDLLAMNSLNTRRISIQVKTKGPGSTVWQTSTIKGRAAGDVPEDEREGRFWVLVDLKPAHPGSYVCLNGGSVTTSTGPTGACWHGSRAGSGGTPPTPPTTPSRSPGSLSGRTTGSPWAFSKARQSPRRRPNPNSPPPSLGPKSAIWSPIRFVAAP